MMTPAIQREAGCDACDALMARCYRDAPMWWALLRPAEMRLLHRDGRPTLQVRYQPCDAVLRDTTRLWKENLLRLAQVALGGLLVMDVEIL